VWRRNLDLGVKVCSHQRAVESLNGWEKKRSRGGHCGQHLVAYRNACDEGLRVEINDIFSDPGGRRGVGGANGE
jgi:hypothetical protein